MASNARKERRHLWWKQHGKQVDDGNDKKKPSIKVGKVFHKGRSAPKKEHLTLDSPPQKEENSKKKTRFIVFIGNLPFNLEKEDIVHHFRCTGGVTDFRLMTKKDGGTSKGCGFLELDDFVSYEKALNLHHSVVGGRKINVEVTCGGGGSGEKRAEKLNDKKKKFRQRRGKKSKSGDDKANIKEGNKAKSNSTEEKHTDLKTDKKTKQGPSKDISEDLDKSAELKPETLKHKKRKLKDDAVDLDASSSEPKKKKKSLKQSNALNSMVKDLDLEAMVQEKQKNNIQVKKEKKKKLKSS